MLKLAVQLPQMGVVRVEGMTQRFATQQKIDRALRGDSFQVTGNARLDGMLDTFDWLGYGAVLIGRDGHVVDLNKQAEDYLGSSIEVVRGQLTARERRAKEGLQDLVASLMGDRGKLGGAPSAVLLPQPNGRPVVAYMAPATSALREGVPELGGIILLLDPSNSREPSESLLQEVFGFTRAEVRLALGLVKHHDL
jgi:hypothetical protein